MPINSRGLRKIGMRAKVPDERNLITVICLSCWGVDCASPDKSKLEWKLHFLELKSRSLELKNYNIRTSISAFYHHFLFSFDLSLQTIIVCFFKWVRRKRKETNGWKIKNANGRFLVQIHPSHFVSKVVCPVPKIAIEAAMVFFKFISHRMAMQTL